MAEPAQWPERAQLVALGEPHLRDAEHTQLVLQLWRTHVDADLELGASLASFLWSDAQTRTHAAQWLPATSALQGQPANPMAAVRQWALHTLSRTDVAAAAQVHLALAVGALEPAVQHAERGGLAVRAATLLEASHRWAEAARSWARIARKAPQAPHYERALLAFNEVRCQLRAGDLRAAQRATTECVGQLEQAADAFEGQQLHERAFDCFEILAELGALNGRFEDVLEGLLNAVRILRGDRLSRFAFERYDQLIEQAVRAGDFGAAASLAEDAANYHFSVHSTRSQKYLDVVLSARWSLAGQLRQRQAPTAQIEQALRQTLAVCGSLRDEGAAKRVYRELASLPLAPDTLAHLTHLQARFAHLPERTLRPLAPAAQVTQPPMAPLWHSDLLEWEHAGCAVEPTALLAFSSHHPTWLRRRALRAHLFALRARRWPSVEARQELAEQLGAVQRYVALAPLNALLRSRSLPLREQVLRALAQLPFKRTLAVLREQARDAPEPLWPALASALQSMHFEHAIEPLRRLLDEPGLPPPLATAVLRALWQIPHDDARAVLEQVRRFGTHTQRALLSQLVTP